MDGAITPLIAGIAGGSVSTMLLFPLDLIKVRLQVNEGTTLKTQTPPPKAKLGNSAMTGVKKSSVKKTTFTSTFRNIIRHEGGIYGLYQGINPALIGSAVSWGGYFFFYERIKSELLLRKLHRQRMERDLPQHEHNHHHNHNHPTTTAAAEPKPQLGSMENFVAACSSGAIMVLLTNPIWLIKTRMQLQVVSTPSQKQVPQIKTQYRGVIHAATTIIREEGPLALYKGAIPAMMLVSHGGIQFVTYEFLKQNIGHSYTKSDTSVGTDGGNHVGNKRKRSVLERLEDSFRYLSMGAVSKLVASTTTYPIQVIKSRLQQRSQNLEITADGRYQVVHREYTGVVDCVRRIWIREGVFGFFKGCLSNAVRVAPSAAITFVVYESTMDLLDENR
mmetsp:Transcript_21329/g.26131  ORF Transcript_21329/g.26131 Transcript_21329/m.26131 type:complete len:389 (+) Transcript_21329:264-1430(+)|eukprot:CAMPEP_0194395006 /NCGR_PEP_ID=MMETSP0174-20130528/124177_1 /TAXON_ID=216777 /ORGANISM="Proboscia alata, Strain PI-D3" /LENGTH=388 /DNA_ID=CAMNT_0039190881 /DNA_START=148 /DNA_END=1314 /DNA_ORIENTATION=-